MVEIPDSLRSLFTATIEERDGRFVIEVPDSEIEHDAATPEGTYRVAILPQHEAENGSEPNREAGGQQEDAGPPTPPVDEGEVREVEVESVGDQGDGIAKVERGYVVIVPETQPGEQPTIEIDDVRQNVAFASIADPDPRTL